MVKIMSVVKITSVLIKAGSEHRFSFGVRAWTEMEIWYAKGMYMLKVVSSGKKRLTFKGIYKSFFIFCSIPQMNMLQRRNSADLTKTHSLLAIKYTALYLQYHP